MVDDAAQAARTEPGETRGLLSAADIRALAERLGLNGDTERLARDPRVRDALQEEVDRVNRDVLARLGVKS